MWGGASSAIATGETFVHDRLSGKVMLEKELEGACQEEHRGEVER